jgi:hypothetical protein
MLTQKALVSGQTYALESEPSYILYDFSTHAAIVILPSLEKIRLSELVVSLAPVTSGFWVVPAIYSVALLLKL